MVTRATIAREVRWWSIGSIRSKALQKILRCLLSAYARDQL